jgi:hypothetical protein
VLVSRLEDLVEISRKLAAKSRDFR